MANKTLSRRPHGVRYPWDEWFDPKRTRIVLVRGQDFNALPHSFALRVRVVAGERGWKVRIEIGEDRVTVTKLCRVKSTKGA